MVAVVILLFGFLGAAMIGDLLALLFPYLPLVVLCVAQFLRPTLLGWFALTALFGSYTVAVAVSFQLPTGEYVPFLDWRNSHNRSSVVLAKTGRKDAKDRAMTNKSKTTTSVKSRG